MHFIKKNFTYFLLVASTIGVGVLALVTAMQLREFRSPTSSSKALTPPCRIAFTIDNTSLRNKEIASNGTYPVITPTTSLISENSSVPSSTPKTNAAPYVTTATVTPTSKMTITPTNAIGAPNKTSAITPTSTPKALALGTTLTPTATIKPTANPTATVKPSSTPKPTSTVSHTATPTVVQPQLPVSGVNLPTIAAVFLGLLMIIAGLFSKKLFFFIDRY